jgi:hypothetical protein
MVSCICWATWAQLASEFKVSPQSAGFYRKVDCSASIVGLAIEFLARHEFMYLIVIAWIYVVLMMSIAEATNSNGTLLGALLTFVLYGAGPVALVVYLMGAPARSKAIKKQQAQARAQHIAASSQESTAATPSIEPDASSHAAGGAEAVASDAGSAPVGKKS